MMGRLGQSRIQVLRCSRYRCARARIFLGRFFFLCLQTLESREILLTKSSHLSCYWNVCKPKSWEKISCTAPLEKTLAERAADRKEQKNSVCVLKKSSRSWKQPSNPPLSLSLSHLNGSFVTWLEKVPCQTHHLHDPSLALFPRVNTTNAIFLLRLLCTFLVRKK